MEGLTKTNCIWLKPLQRQLAISERDWHRLKADHRRAAEQLSAALLLLLRSGAQADGDVVALLESAQRWIKREQRDPGCPDHGRAQGLTAFSQHTIAALTPAHIVKALMHQKAHGQRWHPTHLAMRPNAVEA